MSIQLKRQAPVVVIAAVAACVAAGGASADPSIGAKQAQAQQVMAQITRLDSSLERARTQYESATLGLHRIEHSLKINKVGLQVAHANLVRSQRTLMQRLVLIYMTRDEQSTVGVILGARSIADLVNRVEALRSVSTQDVAVMNQVVRFKAAVTHHRHALVRARVRQVRLVHLRAAAKSRIESELGRQNRLLSSIKGEIAHMIAMEHARQLALANAARARLASQPQDPGAQDLGVIAQTPDATVAPPSQYGGVVGIAMQYLGTPYVWGGESPAGFDCSGFVAYVYAQVGVSLPHYTGAQWDAGVHVSRDQLEPGDLVFFDGLGHVGIYIGGNEFIHAPHSGHVVKISSLDEAWYAATYDGAVRITG